MWPRIICEVDAHVVYRTLMGNRTWKKLLSLSIVKMNAQATIFFLENISHVFKCYLFMKSNIHVNSILFKEIYPMVMINIANKLTTS